MPDDLISFLKTKIDIPAEKYDGSYELVQKTVEFLAQRELIQLGVSDLDMLYFMTVHTRKSSFEDKKQKVRESHLNDEDKLKLISLIDKVQNKVNTNEYKSTPRLLQNGLVQGDGYVNSTEGNMGMFGSAFKTLKLFKTTDEDARQFLEMCIKIFPEKDEMAIFKIAEDTLKDRRKGIGIAVVSQILHCLKPTVFPVINSAVSEMGKLHLQLENPKDVSKYVENTKVIRKFRDENFHFKNYIVLDQALYELSETENANLEDAEEIMTTTGTAMSIDELSHRINDLVEQTELLSQLEKELEWKKENTMKEGWLRWLSQYNEPGAYQRKKLDRQDAEFVYNHLLAPDLLLWLGEASGVSKEIVLSAIAAYRESKPPKASQCLAIRQKIPWPTIEAALRKNTKYDVPVQERLSMPLNQILYGPPGTGKTYKLIKEYFPLFTNPETKEKRYVFITFHQAYSYEEFIEGIRPTIDEQTKEVRYEIKPGIFKTMVQKAIENPDQNFAIFIDEINRGNIAKIFGELITLLEEDKRIGGLSELHVKLPYSNEDFAIPSNLYVIGTMNTADRSIALIDIALRRRFTFIPNYPNYDLEGLQYKNLLQKLNEKILEKNGPDYQIGHSYFIQNHEMFDLQEVMNKKIIPLLQEYFYNELQTIEEILNHCGILIQEEEKKLGRIVFKSYSA